MCLGAVVHLLRRVLVAPWAQDVLQQPVDHIQHLVTLQHSIIGLQVALPLLLHLQARNTVPRVPTLAWGWWVT